MQLIKSLNLKEVSEIDNIHNDGYFINTTQVIIGSGIGYAGFCVDFTFDENGKIVSHAVWE